MHLKLIDGRIRVTPLFVMHRTEERLRAISLIRRNACNSRMKEALEERTWLGFRKYRSRDDVMKNDQEYKWLQHIGAVSWKRLSQLRHKAKQVWRKPNKYLLLSIEDYSLLKGYAE